MATWRIFFVLAVLGFAISLTAIKPGAVVADRYWQISFTPEFAKKNHPVEFWRTHTAGDTVEIYDACDKDGTLRGKATSQKDGSWALDESFGKLKASLAKNGDLNLTLGGVEYGLGQRIAPVTCDKDIPRKITLIEVEVGERTFAAVTGDAAHLESAVGAALASVRSPAPPPLPNMPSTSKILPNGDIYACSTAQQSLAEVRQLINIPSLGTNASLWPGAIIQGKSFSSGNFAPVSVRRAGGKIVMTGVNFKVGTNAKTSADVANMSAESVNNAVRQLITQQVASTESLFDFSAEVVFNKDQMAYSLGVDARFLNGLENIIKFSPDPSKSHVLARFKQTYYTASFEDPESRYSVFQDEENFKDPENQMGADNPPLYVKSVGYGRIIFFLVTSSYDGSAVAQALQSAADGKGDGTAISQGVPVKFSDILRGSTVSYYVQGGDAIASLGGVGEISGALQMYDSIKKTIADAKVAQVTEFSKGLPVTYTVNYLTNRSTAAMGFATTYNNQTCTTTPKKYASFALNLYSVDDKTEIYLIGPDNATIPVYSGSGGSQIFALDGLIPAAQRDQNFTLVLRLYNVAGPSGLTFSFSRQIFQPTPSLNYLVNGVMLPILLPMKIGGTWLCFWIAEYHIRFNRGTGEVAVTMNKSGY